jgi:pyrroloquinoline quinone (PQQ) biosynthesis protein C
MKPRLRHCTMLDDGVSPLRLIVGDEFFDLSEETGTRRTFFEVKRRLDGRHTIREIAEAAGVDESDVEALVELFSRNGLLRPDGDETIIDTARFVDRIEKTAAMWRRQIGYHPLFQGLSRGELRLEVLQGLVIETYHVVRHSSRHIATAIAHAQDEWHRTLLADYLADEKSHESLLLETAARLGLERSAVEQAHPVIGTISLLQMLCEIGRSDTLAYFAATRLFEAAPAEMQYATYSIRQIADAYGLGEAVFEPMMTHARLDVASGHVNLLAKALEGRDGMPVGSAHAIVNHLHDLKHTYDQHHDQIVLYYSDPSNYIPRLRVDYLSL